MGQFTLRINKQHKDDIYKDGNIGVRYFYKWYSRVLICEKLSEEKNNSTIYLVKDPKNELLIQVNYFDFNTQIWINSNKNKSYFKIKGIDLNQTKEWNSKDDINNVTLICGCTQDKIKINNTILLYEARIELSEEQFKNLACSMLGKNIKLEQTNNYMLHVQEQKNNFDKNYLKTLGLYDQIKFNDNYTYNLNSIGIAVEPTENTKKEKNRTGSNLVILYKDTQNNQIELNFHIVLLLNNTNKDITSIEQSVKKICDKFYRSEKQMQKILYETGLVVQKCVESKYICTEGGDFFKRTTSFTINSTQESFLRQYQQTQIEKNEKKPIADKNGWTIIPKKKLG